MNVFRPTANLRFVDRVVVEKLYAPNIPEGYGALKNVRILQQYWERVLFNPGITGESQGEWRDVPTESDSTLAAAGEKGREHNGRATLF